MKVGETTFARELLAPFCKGLGLDLGFGGDAIVPTAITFDSPQPYTNVGSDKQIMRGDALDLSAFCDDSLDYVYSSHLLEDFPPKETINIIGEWLRVIKPGGRLVLLLPDEPVYQQYCRANSEPPNGNHQNHDLTLEWFKKNAVPVEAKVKIEFESSRVGDYSFAIVLRKSEIVR